MFSYILPWVLIASLLGGGLSKAFAQQALHERPVHFERVKGLSHNTVLALLQGPRGFLWIGTLDGLNRYDGYAFEVYRHIPGDTTSLSGNTVRALVEDPEGQIWVGTNRGVSRLDRATGHFVRYSLGADTAGDVASMAIDADGWPWVVTYAQRLYRFDPDAQQFVDAPGRPERASASDSVLIGSLLKGHKGQLWGAQVRRAGQVTLHRYGAESEYVPSVALPGRYRRPQPYVPPITTGADGQWWIGAPSPAPHESGIPVTFVPGLPAEGKYQAIHIDRSGTAWVGSEQGVYRFDPSSETLHHHVLDTSKAAWLSNNVQSLLEDDAGAIWIGTLSGLYRYDPHRKPFVHWGPGTGLPEGSGSHTIMALYEASSGDVWMGTLGSGLLRMEAGRRRVTAYRHQPEDPTSLPSNNVWAVHETAGTLWLGADSVCAFDPRTGHCRRYPFSSHVIAEDRSGHLWFAEAETLIRLDLQSGQYEMRPVGLGLIQALHVPRTGPEVLWIGGERGTLARLDLREDALTVYPARTSAGPPGPSSIWTIHQSSAGRLWVGTTQGLFSFDPATGTFRHFFDAAALPGSIVYSILEDARHRLWMGTSQGLVRFDPRSETFHHYDEADGIGSMEFNRRAAFRSAADTLFFGGLQGVTAFDPAAIRENPYVPPVALTRITVANRDTTRVLRPPASRSLALDYTDYSVAFEFAALNFTNPQKNQYAYRLEGFDAEWVEAGTRRRAHYTNLPAGDYVFQVKGTNNDEVWNEEGASLRLTVAPPVWQTWWFRLLVIGVMIGGLALAYRSRVRHLLEIERLRLRLASDLHDDLGSKLGSVALLSDMLRERTAVGDREHFELKRISAIVRQAAETLRDIVWFVEPVHDRPEALFWKMKNAASEFLNGIEYTFDHPEPNHLAGLAALDLKARRNLFLIFKEALHNVARHAEAEHVEITLRSSARVLELIVTDDGVGFDAERRARPGHGRAHMRRRAEQMGAELELTSQSHQGTTLRLAIPVS